MTTFRVYDIVWSVEGASGDLPSEVEIACTDIASIPDALSDVYGWLVTDYKVGESPEAAGPTLAPLE